MFTAPDTGQQRFHIFQHQVQRGNQDQCYARGKEDAHAEGNSHGDEKLGLAGRFHDHGCQAAEGRQGRQHDEPEARGASLQYGIIGIDAFGAQLVGVVDKDQRVVHNHSGQGHDAQQTLQADAVAQERVPDACSGRALWGYCT